MSQELNLLLEQAFAEAAAGGDAAASTRTSVVRPLVLKVFQLEVINGVRLKNDKVAEMVRALAEEDGHTVKTSGKTVATYRTRNKEVVAEYRRRHADGETLPVEEEMDSVADVDENILVEG